MLIPVKSSNGTALVPLEAKLYEQRLVFLEGEITHELANDFVRQVMDLTLADPDKPIKVFVNSPGGLVDAGLMIYDTIQNCKTPIKLYCTGRAYSMAAIILLCGKNGRYIFPNGKVMLHQPLINTCPGGSASSVKSLSDALMKEKDKLNAIIAKHTGMSMKQVNRATAYDHFYSAEEAVAANLVDEVINIAQTL